MRLAKSKEVVLADEPIRNFLLCTRAIQQSTAGVCAAGQLVHKDDGRVLVAPEAFSALNGLIEPLRPAVEKNE